MKWKISVIALMALATAAQAREQYAAECNVTMPCIGAPAPSNAPATTQRAFNRAPAPSISTVGIDPTLAAKLASIQAACPGTHLISGVRHTRIRGTRVMSLHAQGKAIDVRGPYSCIYQQLRGWPGGYSTDAVRMAHIHISYDASGGREMGLAFRHGCGRRCARRR